jgi:tRNA nucleotidyltransferase (CCA-adding enzyme)
MQVYLVGGAVRDRLLGLPVEERDWVVVGATPQALVDAGYRAVGRDFPVFLHPESHEEYALARLERKVAPGYRGFTTEFSADVTLEDDLRRRDLTINAMAMAADGTLIDPYGGARDIEARVLRHVSEAFAEDPVRVLRVARFAARFAELGFRVAEETMTLMRQMVRDGEVDTLVPERIWRETERALTEARPDAFVETLHDCGALAVVLPEVDALFGVPQDARWHPEIDTGSHVMMALRLGGQSRAALPVQFALLTHDLGKALTPREKWPSHIGHEAAGVPLIDKLSERLRVPGECRDLAVLASRFHSRVHRALELRPATLLELFERSDAFRRPSRFAQLLECCELDARGRAGAEQRDYPQREFVAAAFTDAARAQLSDELRATLAGPAIGAALRAQRLALISARCATRNASRGT